MSERKNAPGDSTLAALLREPRKRGRPRHDVARQTVYVALSADQKTLISRLARQLPAGLGRADVPDMAVMTLATRLGAVRRAVAGRARELPEGITDFESLYYLWDLLPVPAAEESRWTSVRLSPQQAVEIGRLQGALNALFGINRSDVFTLALALLDDLFLHTPLPPDCDTLTDFQEWLQETFL
jgi:hypothetical protein